MSQLKMFAALTRSSSEGPEVMTDEFFNKWTRDAGSEAWTDEHGGRTFASPEYIRIHSLHTLDGREWNRKGGIYWANTEGDLRRFRPMPDALGWRKEFFQAWESNDGELTLEWPSRMRLPPAAALPAGQPNPATKMVPSTSIDRTETVKDAFFHTWTREASGEWVDEYGGRTADRPRSSFEMRTADGKAWLRSKENLWVSRGGECQRQQPPAGSAAAGGWGQRKVHVWVSSDGDLCLGWPSKVLQEQQRRAAGDFDSSPALNGCSAWLRCADEADALAAIRQRRGRAGPGANARAVDALLREALLRQAERVAVERRGGGAADALLLTREDLLGPQGRGDA